ncbi:MAG: hypothetical protein F9K31_11400 [Dokdonella sp.]|nr:MAG: hypothetical protein F9K31_11400 [Dokdonella sp.]
MFRRAAWLAMVGCGLLCAHGQARAYADIDAQWHAPMQAVTAAGGSGALLGGSPPGSDLDPDPAFGGAWGVGMAAYYLDYPPANIGMGLSVHSFGTGWYVMATHQRTDSYLDVAVIRVRPNGLEDGVWLVPTPMTVINDATYDPVGRRFYFVGRATPPLLSSTDFAVTCVDIDSPPEPGPCAGFGVNGTVLIAFDLGGAGNDVATRVVVRPNIGLIVAGTAELTDHREVIAVAALFRATGALVPGFGTGGRYTHFIDNGASNKFVKVQAMALSNDPDAQARIYIAGDYSVDEALTDYDGYVLALNALSGAPDASFDGNGIRPVALNLGDCAVDGCKDAVTAIAVLATGRLALAGWSSEDGNQRFMMGRLRRDGSLDDRFRGGGLAAMELVNFMPKAIAERPNTRDLVVAGDYAIPEIVVQVVSQLEADSGYLHASNYAQFPAATPAQGYSSVAGLLVDADSTLVVGSRRWNATDWDATLFRTLTNDTIFTDQFGGATSD